MGARLDNSVRQPLALATRLSVSLRLALILIAILGVSLTPARFG